MKNLTCDMPNGSQWFAVYRPCSRDSIAKMLGRVGVGKGLNIKGKSAQKNRLSGFVPFLQITDNEHKKEVERSPKDARTKIFYKNVMAREEALNTLNKVMKEGEHVIDGHHMEITNPTIQLIDDFAPSVFGLDAPEAVVTETYIMRPDISPIVGWETGRASVPAFMNMNLHGVRENSLPSVVLYQHDMGDPMNPHGLLIAYAERDPDRVKPVCSDFDTFTVGSKGFKYVAMPKEQLQLVHWELDQASHILDKAPAETTNWTSHWIKVTQAAEAGGYHPKYPSKFGFGEAVSTALISNVVDATKSCGAVRHGPECFNFWFPQEMDKDFLIVWDGYADQAGGSWTPESSGTVPWKAVKEPELRQFLVERAREGFSFPLNPVWAMRDHGWSDVLTALQKSSEEVRKNLEMWLPQDVLQKIIAMHEKNLEGFKPCVPGQPPKPKNTSLKAPPCVPGMLASGDGSS